jgi:hypothetical protein
MGQMWDVLSKKVDDARVDQFGAWLTLLVFMILVFLFVMTLTITLALYYNH